MSFVLFIVAFLASSSSGQESSPVRLDPVVINGAGDNSHDCPSAEIMESARRNISRDISSLFNACGEGNWIPVAYLNMSDTSQQCPAPWIQRSSPARSCGSTSGGTCHGVTFSVPAGVSYSHACGRITGYGYGSVDAFVSTALRDINSPYVDGVSVTHGSPRQHIWSFGADTARHCPCANADRGLAPLPPSFVGDNWFCDVTQNGALWDGRDCAHTGCCTFNNPPWFSVSLPTSTSDDIEVRICTDQELGNEGVQLSLIELSVQ